MKSVSPAKGADHRICSRCRRELLPQLKLPSWRMGMHRGSAEGMTEPTTPDPRAEKIKARKARKARKERKRGLRKAVRSGDLIGAARLFLTALPPEPINEDCPACLKLNRAA